MLLTTYVHDIYLTT